MTDQPASTQRLDRWLWCARLFKTRALAARHVSESGVRITRHENTQRTEKASFGVRVGDTVALTRHHRVVIWEIVALAERRGPATEAQTLYTDHSPPPPPRVEKPAKVGVREAGAGRPTKKDRRSLEKWRDSEHE